MERSPLGKSLVEKFDTMSAQLQSAARYLLEHPRDVALLSMREQARRAGVQPATMTRLAKHLGFAGFEAIRQAYAEALRNEGPGFAGKADAQVAAQRLKGDHAMAADMLQSIGRQITGLTKPASLGRIVDAALCLEKAERIYCLGLRSSHSIAWQLHYMLALVDSKSVMLDGIGGIGVDAIAKAGPGDVLLAASVLPYTRTTIEIAEYAQTLGVSVIAVTDSEVSPLAQIAANIITVPTESTSFFHVMSPAFAVAEVLGALIAGHRGERAVTALQRSDRMFAALNTHIKQRNPKKRP